MRTSLSRIVVAAAVLAAVALAGARPARAVGAKVWRITTWKDFDEGEEEGVLLSSSGEAQAGFGASRLDVPVAQVFSAVTAPDGAVWLGTGDQADLYVWDGGKEVKKACHLDAVLVSALAAAPDGTIYAGTLPGGKVWEVKGGAGKPVCRALARLEGADQVWALALDPAKKTAWAATGPGGKLFAVDLASGKARVLWESGEKHLLSLARVEGGLVAGSAEEAILYRVGEDGSARALQDFAGDEIRAVVAGPGGALYVAVNEFERKGPAASAPGARPQGIKMVLPSGTIPAAGSLPPGRDRKGKGAVFRVDGDGRVEQLHALADGYFTALAANKQGDLYAAAANGRVYLVRPDRTLATAWNFPERQVLALALDGAHPAIGTGDSGALYGVDLGAASGKASRWFSKTLDAGAGARWGAVRWAQAGSVTIETRSGNTAKPDKSWSDWQSPTDARRGPSQQAAREQREGHIASPAGRYLQIRATFGKDAHLFDVAAWFLPQNQRARVTDIAVGEDPTSGVARAARAAGKPRSPVVKIRWKVENPDDDDLVYRAFFREEGEPNWKPIGGPDPLTGREIDWNTELVPDGNYVIRVVASDERANAKDDALDHELVSPPWLVDNRKPEVIDLAFSAAGGFVTGIARDSFSPIAELAFSVDGGEWLPLAPKDRLLDDTSEAFTIKLPDTLAPGAHAVTVRAVDAADNVGLGTITLQIRK